MIIADPYFDDVRKDPETLSPAPILVNASVAFENASDAINFLLKEIKLLKD